MRRLAFIAAACVLAGCDRSGDNFGTIDQTLDQQVRAQLGQWNVVQVGAVNPPDTNLARLGRALMFDKILSGNRDVACASCHQPSLHLTDGRSLAVGTRGRLVFRGAPTLVDVGLGPYALFWDARLTGPDLLARQAMLPVLNRTEMRGDSADGGGNELAVIADTDSALIYAAIMSRLMAVSAYKQMFDAAFPGTSHDFTQAARAIAAFETGAATPHASPFDRYLAHDDGALSEQEKRGALLFFTTGRCSQCHNGPLLGGNGGIANTDVPQIGTGLDSGSTFYRFGFRVPPLRNVELTAPYFHDGAFPTLEAVVRHYNDVRASVRGYDPLNVAAELRPLVHTDGATISLMEQTLDGRVQQPLGLTAGEQADLVAFLKSLTDPAARDLSALKPASVPSGLPVP